MKRFIPFLAFAFAAGCAAPNTQMPPARAAILEAGENADLAFGGIGTQDGQFTRLRDLTFGPDGLLYTLESAGREASKDGEVVGLGRVQVFDGKGTFLRGFSLGDDAQIQNAVNEKNEDGPMAAARIAVDGQNRVYVSFPQAGLVRVFGWDGAKISDITLPNALALARNSEGKIVAVASRKLIAKNGWEWQGGDSYAILGESGIEKTVPLDQTLWNVQDVAVAPGGDVLVLGAPARPKYDWNPQPMIFRFDPSGKTRSTLGSGVLTRSEDGSEPLHSVAVAKNGDIVTMTWGNPGKTVRYSGDGRTVTTTFGWFRWAESWSSQGGYAPLALDPDDRLWVGVTQINDPKNPNYPRMAPRPAIVRAKPDFFAPGAKNVLVADARGLGFLPQLQTSAPYNIAYEAGKPVDVNVVVAPARRATSKVDVAFRVFDDEGQLITTGQTPLPMPGADEARAKWSFTPPRFGSYSVVADYKIGPDVLRSQAMWVGVTPRFANLPELKNSPGGWEDAPRQVFTGLRLMRLHPDKDGAKWRDKLDTDLKSAKESGALVFLQLTDQRNNFTPERAREVMEFAKGRVPYVELFNEPDLSMKPEDYVALAKPAYDAIKAVDPTVQVLGPAICGVKLGWLDAFYKAGGKATCDIMSVHDYEGHESISPEHWNWKFAELRKVMAQNGDADKPVWQSERAISAVRGGLLTGESQAIRVTLHRDLLSALGISDDHNSHYYLNQGGYSSVPTYVWSQQGPLPAALALRARAGMIGERAFAGNLDFGPLGNTLFLGARYRDQSGEVVSLRNLIGAPQTVVFTVAGGAPQVFDAWGNPVSVAPGGGVLSLSLGQMPTYVRLTGNARLTPHAWDWGKNLALGATVAIEGKVENDPTLLTNGQIETIHAGNPAGDTNGKNVVRLLEFSPEKPAIVTLQMAAPARFNRVVVRGLRADNQFSALRDFDVQVRQGGAWRTVGKSGTTIPPTVLAKNADATAITFYGDDNGWIVSFPSVQSDAVRLVIRDATRGFAPDDLATSQVMKAWGNANPLAASLREIEVYQAP